MIERPLHELFEFMGSLETLPLWLEGCRRPWPAWGEPREAGSMVAHLDEFMGTSFESHFRVLESEPNSRMVFEMISGPRRGGSEHIVDKENGTSRMEINVRGELVGCSEASGGWSEGPPPAR